VITDVDTYQARRLYCRDALMGRVRAPELAERWCEAWEAYATLHGRERSGEFWAEGLRWIEDRIGPSPAELKDRS
jgi:hypothetical protein